MPVAGSTPSAGAVDVILRDGATLRLRAPAAEDAGPLTAFFGAMSDRSLYLRFHGLQHIDDALIRPATCRRGPARGTAARTDSDKGIVMTHASLRRHPCGQLARSY